RYYLFTLVVNLSRDTYELRLLLAREYSGKRGKIPEEKSLQAQRFIPRLRLQLFLLLQVLRDNPPLLLDFLRNLFDLIIPLEKLGMCRSNPGFLGFCGLVSSLLSILTILQPWLKLKP
ncbi:PREDICTED: peroxisomal membrane protein 11B-like, partial [Acanthisitta chloris]|uniref:peroxisomal membrane protein 11B-like n=1 Tax=Acanthisitta chloris TaxID=57068 RepID=UPI0004F0D172